MINEERLITYLIGSLVIFFLGVFVNQWLGKRKEYREYSKWQFGNLKDIFFDKYLSEETINYRKKVRESEVVLEPKSSEKYHLAIALQQLGFNAYLGIIPMEPILAGNAPQVVSDFVLVNDQIEAIRGFSINNNKVPFQRRHGEWIACICFMWLSTQKFSLPDKDRKAIREYADLYGGLKNISEREKLLFNIERDLVKIHTRNIIKQIRYRYFMYRAFKLS